MAYERRNTGSENGIESAAETLKRIKKSGSAYFGMLRKAQDSVFRDLNDSVSKNPKDNVFERKKIDTLGSLLKVHTEFLPRKGKENEDANLVEMARKIHTYATKGHNHQELKKLVNSALVKERHVNEASEKLKTLEGAIEKMQKEPIHPEIDDRFSPIIENAWDLIKDTKTWLGMPNRQKGERNH